MTSAATLASDWSAWMRTPLARSLLLSLAVHVAVIALLRPAPGGDGVRPVIIQARLMDIAAQQAAPSAAPVAEDAPLPAMPTEPEQAPPAPEPVPLTTPAPSPLPSPPPPPAQAAERMDDAAAGAPAPAPVVTTPTPAHDDVTRTGPSEASPLPSVPLGIDDTWYLARQVDRHPRAIGRIEPEYPEEARHRGVEGTLKLKLRIDPLGRVRAAEVVEAVPPGVFEQAALAAFRDARFEPAMRDGRPVRYEAYIRVDFRLSD
jgi:protein TonB